MADQPLGDLKSLKAKIDRVVVAAIVGVALFNGGSGWLVTALEHRTLEASAEDYIEFGTLYLSTFLLSATITAAIGSWEIPKLYGITTSWQIPVGIVVGGAYLTGRPIESNGGTPAGLVYGALEAFAEHYGLAFMGGLITGAAGAAILWYCAEHYKGLTA